jgi:acyl carrier protein
MSQDNRDIEERAKKIISSQLGCKLEDVKPASNIQSDLQADSLDAIELIMALEEEFELEIPDEEAEKLVTVGLIYAYLDSHVKIPV